MGVQAVNIRCLRYVEASRDPYADHFRSITSDPSLLYSEPSTSTVLGKVANCTLEDFRTAIQSASDVQAGFFEGTTGASRGAMLRKWNDLILANADDRKLSDFQSMGRNVRLD